MEPYFLEKFGNASSIHRYGQEARAALDASRATIAGALKVQAGEITFVSGGTEADNAAIKGLAREALRRSGKNHIITSRAEHHAVLDTCAFLASSGFSVTVLHVDRYGMVDPDAVRKAIRPETALISIMHANNEVGTINPIAEVGTIAREREIPLHSDAVQTFGKLDFTADDLHVDAMSISAHKIYGPKGIGALYLRRGTMMERLLHGGGQERGRRAGTESVPLAVGFASASELMTSRRAEENKRLSDLRASFREKLAERFPAIRFNGHPSLSLPHILNCSFDSRAIAIDGEALLFNLDLAGIAVTSGSACTSGSMEPSHVLLAMGVDEQTARATIRFSMGRSTTEDDLEYTIEQLEAIVKRIGRPTR